MFLKKFLKAGKTVITKYIMTNPYIKMRYKMFSESID